MTLRTYGILRWLLPIVLASSLQTLAENTIHTLNTEDPTTAQSELDATAIAMLEAGGGIIVIPADAPAELTLPDIQQADRKGPGVTVVDMREGFLTYHVPPMGHRGIKGSAGHRLSRFLNLSPYGNRLPFWGSQPVQQIQNVVVSGATSYDACLTQPVAAGDDVRLYVDTIRGIHVGQYLVITSGVMTYKKPFDRITVKSLGWDAERKANYFTADLKHPHEPGDLVYNKHPVGSLAIESYSNADNQTKEFEVNRRTYGVGDNFAISATNTYMSDIFSGFGDEGAVLFNAEVKTKLDSFHSTVESIDWGTQELVYTAGLTHAETLANSRPLINLNQEKWITKGTVRIVPPDKPYKGESFADRGGGPGNAFNYQGGAIIGSPDCGWTEDIVGRFFTITDDTEVILPNERSTAGGYAYKSSRRIHRWYRIAGFETTATGEPRLKIMRVRWSAVAAGAPNLYLEDNFTWDEHERPLSYAIAPGTWVADIGRGWVDAHSTGGQVEESDSRILKLTPSSDMGTAFDFAPGDEIEQAIGPDPWHPRPLRIRTFDQVPSTMPNASIEVQQQGRVQTHTGLMLRGITRSSEDLTRRKDGKPSYHTMIDLYSMSDIGIEFRCEVVEAAIMFRQPNGRPQPLVWQLNNGEETTLSVAPAGEGRGDMQIRGGHLDIGEHSLKQAQGLSATSTPAHNLRGINVPVTPKATRLEVKFDIPEVDANYAITVQPTWFTADRLAEKTANSFVIEFQTAAPDNATIDWQLIR